MTIGMLASSAPLTPELIRMRTIGTVNSRTNPALSSTLLDLHRCLEFGGTHAVQEEGDQHHRDENAAGRYSGSMPALMPASPRMLAKATETDFSAAPTCGNTRLITSSAPTST